VSRHESARKPYYSGERSIVDFFKEPVRYLKESNSVESAFEKPYAVEDEPYNKMHLDWSLPDWEWIWGPTPEGARPNPRLCIQWNTPPHCKISVDDEGRVSARIWRGIHRNPLKDWRVVEAVLTSSNPEVATGPLLTQQSRENEFFLEGEVDLSGCSSGTEICIEYKSKRDFCASQGFPDGSTGVDRKCCTWVSCTDPECTPPEYEEMTWLGMEPPASIARNSSTDVSFTGGKPPFIWTISGDGFSFGGGAKYLKTSSRTVVVYTDGTACGAGVIAVSDDCDKQLGDGAVLCTEGQWVTVSSSSGFTYDYSDNCPGSNLHCSDVAAAGQIWNSGTVTAQKGRYKVSEKGSQYAGGPGVSCHYCGGYSYECLPCCYAAYGLDGVVISNYVAYHCAHRDILEHVGTGCYKYLPWTSQPNIHGMGVEKFNVREWQCV